MVTLIQTEQTFNVVDEVGKGYTVTMTTDLPNAYIDYDVFDDEGEEVVDDDVVTYIISLVEETL